MSKQQMITKPELLISVKTKHNRNGVIMTDALYRIAAALQYGSDDIEINADAPVIQIEGHEDGGDDGAFVQAWVWVYNAKAEGQK